MYCSLDDIKTDFGGLEIEATGTKVTIATCEAWIKSESNYIDSYLISKYKMPVIELDSPLAFELVKRICIFRVSERVRNVVEVKVGSVKTDQDAKGQTRTPVSDLNRILDGRLRLIDCPIATPDSGIAFGINNSAGKPFDISKDQW